MGDQNLPVLTDLLLDHPRRPDKGINTVAKTEVAYQLRSIAKSLLQAMMAIDEKKIGTGPNDLLFYIQRIDTRFGPDLLNIGDFDLGDLEDLYYATCGKVKDLLQSANIHMTNGFKKLDDPYVHFRSLEIDVVSAVPLGDFVKSLLAKEAVLYSNEITTPLNRAIQRKNMLKILDGESSATDVISGYDSAQYGPIHDGLIRQGVHFERIEAYKATAALKAQGLQDMRKKSCSMIFGELSEKYRPILAKEAAERAQKEHMRAFKRAQVHREETYQKLCGGSGIAEKDARPEQDCGGRGPHVNPYNLTSRIERLEDPNGPDFPCLCDPHCFCAPLCAGEPEKNCLCETDPLFWRVTTGYEIEELLARADDEKYPRNNRLAQLMVGGFSSPQALTFSCAVSAVEAQLAAMEEIQLQKHEAAKTQPKPCPKPATFVTPANTYEHSLSIHATTPTFHTHHKRRAHVPQPINVCTEMLSGPRSSQEECIPTPLFGGRRCVLLPGPQHPTFANYSFSAGAGAGAATGGMRGQTGSTHHLAMTKGMGRVSQKILSSSKVRDGRSDRDSQASPESKDGRKRSMREGAFYFETFKRVFRPDSQSTMLSSNEQFQLPRKCFQITSQDPFAHATR
ncbi:MAG: hypothetical protein M1830_009427 [Pleopsidium flavum]|nr:MAG: hypothetical protein M1830_009427 [Pleopsidium flavum]